MDFAKRISGFKNFDSHVQYVVMIDPIYMNSDDLMKPV